jgi:hypothetical protein
MNIWKFSRNTFWSSFSRLAWLKVLARATISKTPSLRFWPKAFTFWHLAFSHHYASHVHITWFMIFYFFFHIPKIISHGIMLQIDWNDLHNDPQDLYYFLMIFMTIVHVWFFEWPRVCSHVFFHAPCLMFWSWNDDA